MRNYYVSCPLSKNAHVLTLLYTFLLLFEKTQAFIKNAKIT
jgi:hypothetical protein